MIKTIFLSLLNKQNMYESKTNSPTTTVNNAEPSFWNHSIIKLISQSVLFVCVCVRALNKQNVINRQGKMFVFLIRQTKGRDVLAARSKFGRVRNQLVPRRTVRILIPSCANHHNAISDDKLSPIYGDN